VHRRKQRLHLLSNNGNATNILITNDDGIESPGLSALHEALAGLGRVIVVAPNRERSATSHCITLNYPLHVEERGEDRYAVEGTPADCVIMASIKVLQEKPDLVVSGVNRGLNVGDDICYSGTVGAATEALLQGIPSMAISTFAANNNPNFAGAARIAAILAERIRETGLPPNVLLNVNYPETWNNAIMWTRQGRRGAKTILVEESNAYSWFYDDLHRAPSESASSTVTDFAAIASGYVSVSPIQLDRSAYGYMSRFADWAGGLKF
jgi:5'-nucleotidase